MFVIRWNWTGDGQKGPFVRDIRSNTPYTIHVEQAKKWKTRAGAERWLKRKDEGYAAACSIEEVSE